MNNEFGRNNWFYKTSQRSREYDSGQYISVIDQVDEAQKQNKELKGIRTELVNFYKGAAPQLFEGLRVDLGGLNRGIQESISEHNRANDSLEQIRYSLDHGFESVSARLDRGNSLLDDLLHVNSNPSETKANEQFRIAMRFFADGLYPEAHLHFEEAVNLDIANFVALYLIGVIRFEQFRNIESALKAFAKCDRYASIRGVRYFSKSLYQQALINQSMKALDDAQSLAEKSYAVDSNNYQACFLVAQVAAERGELSVAKKYLKKCEVKDVIFYARSRSCAVLVESGVHDSVYSEVTQKLIEFNKETLRIFSLHYRNIQKYREYADYLVKEKYPVEKALDRVEIESRKLINFPEVPEKNDYLDMLLLHDVLAKEAEKIKTRLSKAFEALSGIPHGVHDQRVRPAQAAMKEAEHSGNVGCVAMVIAGIAGWTVIGAQDLAEPLHIIGAILFAVCIFIAAPIIARQIQMNSLKEKIKAAEFKPVIGFENFKSVQVEVSKISARNFYLRTSR